MADVRPMRSGEQRAVARMLATALADDPFIRWIAGTDRDRATAWMLDECVVLRPMNAFIIPHTVPKSPMKGAALAVVARKVQYFSSFVISTLVARFMALETLSTPPNSVVKLSPTGESFFERDTRTSSS